MGPILATKTQKKIFAKKTSKSNLLSRIFFWGWSWWLLAKSTSTLKIWPLRSNEVKRSFWAWISLVITYDDRKLTVYPSKCWSDRPLSTRLIKWTNQNSPHSHIFCNHSVLNIGLTDHYIEIDCCRIDFQPWQGPSLPMRIWKFHQFKLISDPL